MTGEGLRRVVQAGVPWWWNSTSASTHGLDTAAAAWLHGYGDAGRQGVVYSVLTNAGQSGGDGRRREGPVRLLSSTRHHRPAWAVRWRAFFDGHGPLAQIARSLLALVAQ